MPLFDHFDLVAPCYDRIFRPRGAPVLISLAAPEMGHHLLDVGGGTGRIAQYLVHRVARACILDPSPGMLRESRHGSKLDRHEICAIRGLAERIPFATGVFDRIIVVDAFHHLIDQRVAVGELLRVLASGGRLVIEEPDIAHWAVKLVAIGEKLLLMRSHFYCAADIAAMFSSVGCQVCVERQGYTFWVIVDKS